VSRFIEIYEAELLKQCDELIARHERYINWINGENARSARFLLSPRRMRVKKPDSWACDRKHNPYIVRNRVSQISRSVVSKLIDGTYRPNAPFIRTVPKKGGGVREVCEFQIPDSVVSDLYYRKLLAKNRHRFSSYAYAYRDDRNVHYAIQELRVSLVGRNRLFVAEYDFSKFFDSIDHGFLLSQLSSNGLLVTDHERIVIRSFLQVTKPGGTGIPQGTSISLFLANVACGSLDRRFEEAGVRFARYADDTLIWSGDFGKICTAVEAISEFSRDSGVRINAGKSDGISLLTASGMKSELHSHKTFVDFLGYRISPECTGMKAGMVARMKKRVSAIIDRCMLAPIRSGSPAIGAIPANNRDDALMIAICMIRRYLYGNLQEEFLRGYINGKYSHLSFLGLMSFYPLVDDQDQLKRLDQWLLHTLHRAAALRYRMLTANPVFGSAGRVVFNNPNSSTFLAICDQQLVNGKRLYSIPSFLRIARAINKRVLSDGVEAAMHPKSNRYGYDAP
jgi:RNA-directed DNA polymerase